MNSENFENQDLSSQGVDVSSSSQADTAPAGYVPQHTVNAMAKGYKTQLREARNQIETISSGYSQEEIDKRIAERAEAIFQSKWEQREAEQRQKQENEQYQTLANTFASRVSPGMAKYTDFQDKTQEVINYLGTSPALTAMLAHDISNPADVIYHLANNTNDLIVLNSLMQMGQAQAIKKHLSNLSERLSKNSQGESIRPKAPLSQVHTSNTLPDDVEVKDSAYYARKYR